MNQSNPQLPPGPLPAALCRDVAAGRPYPASMDAVPAAARVVSMGVIEAEAPDRDWKSVGRDWTATREQRSELSADFAALNWKRKGDDSLSASAGLALREIIDCYMIRRPLAFAESGPGSSQPIIAIRARYSDRVIQAYYLDRGHEAIPLAVDSFFGAEAEKLTH